MGIYGKNMLAACRYFQYNGFEEVFIASNPAAQGRRLTRVGGAIFPVKAVRGNGMNLSENEKKIFELVRHNDGIGRSDISRKVRISKSTVERCVSLLVEKGLFSETTLGDRRRGRAGIALSVNSGGPMLVGLELNNNELLVAAAVDLIGSILARVEIPISTNLRREQILDVLISATERILADTGGRDFFGIGFGNPGMVDEKEGRAIFSSSFIHWEDVPVARLLSERFAVPVYAIDTPRARCLAEARHGVARGVDSFLYVDYGVGIGLGIFSKGRLFSGGQGLGGEIGHFVIDSEGAICGCGGRGCIQTVVSEKVVVEKAREIIAGGVHTMISDWIDGPSHIEARHIYRAAEMGDRFALNLLEPVISVLGTVVGGVCSLLNPTLVVLGKIPASYPRVWEPIKKIIRRSTLPYIERELDIQFSSVIENCGLIGTTELVVERLFYPSRPA